MPRRQQRPCCAICAATGVAWTRQQPTTTRRSSPFSWRKVRPWTSWPGRPRPRLSPRETPRPPECARGPRVPRVPRVPMCPEGREEIYLVAASNGHMESAKLLLAAKAPVDIFHFSTSKVCFHHVESCDTRKIRKIRGEMFRPESILTIDKT